MHHTKLPDMQSVRQHTKTCKISMQARLGKQRLSFKIDPREIFSRGILKEKVPAITETFVFLRLSKLKKFYKNSALATQSDWFSTRDRWSRG